MRRSRLKPVRSSSLRIWTQCSYQLLKSVMELFRIAAAKLSVLYRKHWFFKVDRVLSFSRHPLLLHPRLSTFYQILRSSRCQPKKNLFMVFARQWRIMCVAQPAALIQLTNTAVASQSDLPVSIRRQYKSLLDQP